MRHVSHFPAIQAFLIFTALFILPCWQLILQCAWATPEAQFLFPFAFNQITMIKNYRRGFSYILVDWLRFKVVILDTDHFNDHSSQVNSLGAKKYMETETTSISRPWQPSWSQESYFDLKKKKKICAPGCGLGISMCSLLSHSVLFRVM